MSNNNRLTDKHLDRLAEICCDVIDGTGTAETGQTDELLKSLIMSGYAREECNSLSEEIEKRVKDRCSKDVLPRGPELSALIEQMQEKYNELKRWHSNQPDNHHPPQAANISSATES